MKRRMKQKHIDTEMSWLPVDSRLFLPLFSFGHVKGVAKVFLVIEMVLAAGVVTGTFIIMLTQLFVSGY